MVTDMQIKIAETYKEYVARSSLIKRFEALMLEYKRVKIINYCLMVVLCGCGIFLLCSCNPMHEKVTVTIEEEGKL